jgi:branched-chain amino acid transport system permease protein
MVMQNGLSLVFGDGNKALRTWPAGEGFALAGARVTGVQIAIVIAASLLLIAVWLLLHRTGVGLRFRAVSNDQDLASAVGTHVDRSILLAFALGSALAGGAAILISLDVDMTPNMGFIGLMMAVAASIVGGIGSIPGAALGALIVAFAQQLSAWWLPSQWQDPIAFGILFVFLIIRPQGVFGQRIKKASI